MTKIAFEELILTKTKSYLLLWQLQATFRIISAYTNSNRYYNELYCAVVGQDSSVYRTWLQARRSGDRIPVGGKIFRTCLDQPCSPPSLLHNGYQVFLGVKSGMTLTPHPLLVPWSRKRRAIPLLPLWTARPVHSFSACTRVQFYFFTVQFIVVYW
jgi:hypothetical protein